MLTNKVFIGIHIDRLFSMLCIIYVWPYKNRNKFVLLDFCFARPILVLQSNSIMDSFNIGHYF